ncbi:MAG TPA: 50S ribosomal protein L21 [Candidatus Bathyarchaeia archaeon]|nr:50S ribosomal protein L21 [Candidatus Bathyarchaeia archaeon]
MVKIKKQAVIQTGGKQYLVAEGESLKIEKIEGKAKDEIIFDEVLLIKTDKLKIGMPQVTGARVQAEILDQTKEKKIRVSKFRAKSRYRRVKGHRQLKTIIKILKISS